MLTFIHTHSTFHPLSRAETHPAHTLPLQALPRKVPELSPETRAYMESNDVKASLFSGYFLFTLLFMIVYT